MAYCPTCKQQYQDQTACPADGAALVDSLPFQTVDGQGGTWVEIATTGTEDEARLLQGFLDAEGIPAQIENLKFSMEPINFGSMGDIRIYVSADDEQQAMSLLKERERAYDRLDDDADTLVTDEGVAQIDEGAVAEPEKE